MIQTHLQNIAVGILCGGKSRRFGRDKCLVNLGRKRLIEYVLDFEESLQIPFYLIMKEDGYNQMKKKAFPELVNHTIVFDLLQKSSSLTGIYSALVQSSFAKNLIIACDMPFIPISLLNFMISCSDNYDVVVPTTKEGYQPLCAIYSRNCIPFIEKQLKGDIMTVYKFYSHIKLRKISEKEMNKFGNIDKMFLNINTIEDFNQAQTYLR